MSEIKKIKIGTDGGNFDWLLENDKNACEANSDMIRVLVEKHNELVEIISEMDKRK